MNKICSFKAKSELFLNFNICIYMYIQFQFKRKNSTYYLLKF